MKKRIIGILLAFAVLVSACVIPVSAADGGTITVKAGEIVDGKVTVTVSYTGNPGVASATVWVGFDNTKIVPESYTLGTVFSGPVSNLQQDIDYSTLDKVTYNSTTAGNQNGNGTLITVVFRVLEGDWTETELTVKKLDFANQKYEYVYPEVVTDKVTLPEIDFTLKGYEGTYDGTEHTLTATGPDGVEYKYENNGRKDVGTTTVTVTATKAGCVPTTKSADIKITPKTLTVTGVKAENKTYDKTNVATISGGTLNGVVSGDSVNALVPKTGTFASVNAGNNIAVAIDDITLDGEDADNYILAPFTTALKANIEKANVTVKADDKTKRVGAADEELTYTVTEGTVYEGDSFTGTLTRVAGETVKTYAITKGTLSLGSNYNLTVVPGTYTIVDKNVQNVIVSGIENKTYGDEPFTVGVEFDENSRITEAAFESSDDSVVTVDDKGNAEVVGVGIANITVTVPGNADYAPFEKTLAIVVAQREIRVTADDLSKRTGDEDPEFTFTYTGELVGDDAFTGKLTRVSGEKAGEYAIKQGTLALNNNYKIIFTEGLFTIADKDVQNVKIAAIEDKTYGDEPFEIEVIFDENSGITEAEFKSSNEKVAEVDEDGVVTVIGSGSTNITVTVPGNEDYAQFEKVLKLTVAKRTITVNIDSCYKKIGEDDPEFTYTYTGELVGDDEFTGELTRTAGEKVGTYAIKKGTLALNANYTLIVNEGKLTITDKTPQNVEIGDVDTKTYGDEDFAIDVIPDPESGIDRVTYKSDNTKVATVDENGVVTIKRAGRANITVTVAGNAEYAEFVKTIPITVEKKTISIDDIDLATGLVTSGDIVGDDEVYFTLSGAISEIVGDAGDGKTYVTIKGIDLEENSNYVIEKSQTNEVEVAVENEYLVEVTLAAAYGTVTGDGTYLKGTTVTVNTTPDKGYKLSGWYNGSKKLTSDAEYTFVADADIKLTAKFTRKTSTVYTIAGGTSSSSNKNNDLTGDEIVPKMTVKLTIDSKVASVDGDEVSNDVAPIIVNNRTMLPARFVAETLGAKVEWDATERKVTITGNNKVIEIYIGSDKAYVNGFQKTLDSPAFIENDRTYTPIRFVAENLGAEVEWNSNTRVVTITR